MKNGLGSTHKTEPHMIQNEWFGRWRLTCIGYSHFSFLAWYSLFRFTGNSGNKHQVWHHFLLSRSLVTKLPTSYDFWEGLRVQPRQRIGSTSISYDRQRMSWKNGSDHLSFPWGEIGGMVCARVSQWLETSIDRPFRINYLEGIRQSYLGVSTAFQLGWSSK